MANPQRENGHIDIANELADHFCRYRLSGQEWQILWVIVRKTWGYAVIDDKGKSFRDKGGVVKKKTDRIPFSQFARLTGIDRRKCHKLLKRLVEKGIVSRIVTQNGDRTVIAYGIQKNYDNWKVPPKKVTVAHNGDNVTPKRATKVSPKKAHSKEKKESTAKERSKLDGFDEGTISLSKLLRRLILENKPNRKLGRNWLPTTCTEINRMILIDRRDPNRVGEIIRWCQADNEPRGGNGFYWAKNILSGSSLREQFDKLEQDMQDKSRIEVSSRRRSRFGV